MKYLIKFLCIVMTMLGELAAIIYPFMAWMGGVSFTRIIFTEVIFLFFLNIFSRGLKIS